MRLLLIGGLGLLLRLLSQPAHAAAVPEEPSFLNNVGRFVGTFTDATTGQDFDLYDHSSSGGGIAQYYANANGYDNSTASAEKRGWLDCQGLSTPIKTACCNTAHGFGNLFKDLSLNTLGAFINDEISQAFSGGRGNQSPRSICHTYDSNNLCTSWANYDSNQLQNGESADMANFAASCAKDGYSSEFKGTDSSGGVIYVCVSNRATGCSDSVG